MPINLKNIFPIKRGVRQGDPIFSILFNGALEIFKNGWEGKGEKGININGVFLNNLRFVDNVVLIEVGRTHKAQLLKHKNYQRIAEDQREWDRLWEASNLTRPYGYSD